MPIPTQGILPQIQDPRILHFQTYVLYIVLEEYNAVGKNTEQMTIYLIDYSYSDKYRLYYDMITIRS